jgi:beta-lactamase regulating signal transducer with metallopeptidase domain
MIEWLADTLFAVTVLMLLVLALRRPVARFFGAGWAYALWLLPALRLALPPIPMLCNDIVLPSAAVVIPAVGEATAPLPAAAGPGQWVPFLIALWAGGAVVFLIWQWLAYREFLHKLEGGGRPGRPPSYGGIATWESPAVDGPVAMGVTRPRIILPFDFARRYGASEQRLALEHELTHHRRGDLWWNSAALVVLALNWFNPVAWFAFRAFRDDQELSCDAAVARGASAEERHDYARALVKAASRPGLIAACPLNPAGQLKRRLRMLKNHRGGRVRAAGGFAFCAGVTAFGLAFSSPGFNPPERAADEVYLAAAEAAAPAPAKAEAAPAAVSHGPAADARPAVRVAKARPRAAAASAPAATFDAAPAAAPAHSTEVVRLAQLDPPASDGRPPRFAFRVERREVLRLPANADGPPRMRVVVLEGSTDDPARRAAMAAALQAAVESGELRGVEADQVRFAVGRAGFVRTGGAREFKYSDEQKGE